jgi:hypothetical protein
MSAHLKILGERLCLDDFAAAQAGGADADALALSIDLGVNRPQIDVPAPLGHVVGVADAVSRLRLLAADITLLCHDDGDSQMSSELVRQTLILQELLPLRQTPRPVRTGHVYLVLSLKGINHPTQDKGSDSSEPSRKSGQDGTLRQPKYRSVF